MIQVTRLRQETPLTNRVESALAKATQQQNANIEQTLFSQVTQQREFLNSLEVAVKVNIEKTIPMVVQDIVEPLKRQLRIDASQIDGIVKDNMMKMFGGPQVREAVSVAATIAARPALEHAFREAFTGILLPGMEKACQNMFKQVQDAFLTGTRECFS